MSFDVSAAVFNRTERNQSRSGLKHLEETGGKQVRSGKVATEDHHEVSFRPLAEDAQDVSSRAIVEERKYGVPATIHFPPTRYDASHIRTIL